jgi:O-antigen/teichoic acid export membrane protein
LGIVRKQALANSIFSYIGVALGYLNVIILFPAFFSSDEFGLLSLIITVSITYSYLSAIGLANTIPRFFPFFKTDDKLHNGFMSYIFLIGVAGFLIITVLFIVLRPLIISAYIDKSAAFIDYYYFLIPLSLFTLLFNVFESITRAIYKTGFATFLKETLLRLLTTVGILLFMFKILNFNQFIYFYIIINGICALMLLFQIIFSKEFVFKFRFKDLTKEKFFEIMKYGGFLYISSASMIIGQSGADTLFLGSMVGLSVVGAYTIYMRIATLIYVPMRSLSKISVPIIANCFKENDTKQIADIYKRTSLIQLILGCLIYVGVIINKHNLAFFLKKPEYIDSFNIFYFIGIAFLIDIAVGLNSEIIVNSPKYRFDPLFNIILLIVSITANYLLIPVFGGVGAALAAIASFFAFNFIKWLFIVINFKMQPLGYKQLIVIGITIITYFISNAIPTINNVFADAFIRSGIAILIYAGLTLGLKVSSDLNERFVVYKNLFKNFFTTKST